MRSMKEMQKSLQVLQNQHENLKTQMRGIEASVSELIAEITVQERQRRAVVDSRDPISSQVSFLSREISDLSEILEHKVWVLRNI